MPLLMLCFVCLGKVLATRVKVFLPVDTEKKVARWWPEEPLMPKSVYRFRELWENN